MTEENYEHPEQEEFERSLSEEKLKELEALFDRAFHTGSLEELKNAINAIPAASMAILTRNPEAEKEEKKREAEESHEESELQKKLKAWENKHDDIKDANLKWHFNDDRDHIKRIHEEFDKVVTNLTSLNKISEDIRNRINTLNETFTLVERAWAPDKDTLAQLLQYGMTHGGLTGLLKENLEALEAAHKSKTVNFTQQRSMNTINTQE